VKHSTVTGFKRTFKVTNGAPNFWTQQVTVDSMDLVYHLQDFPNFTEFTNLFDEYRINKVVIKVIPHSNTAEYNIAPSREISRWQSCQDDTDASAITEAAMMNYASFKDQYLSKPVSRTFRPAVSIQTYVSLTATGYSAKKGLWLQTTSADVPHYCGKSNFINYAASVTNPIQYEIVVTAHGELRGMR